MINYFYSCLWSTNSIFYLSIREIMSLEARMEKWSSIESLCIRALLVSLDFGSWAKENRTTQLGQHLLRLSAEMEIDCIGL